MLIDFNESDFEISNFKLLRINKWMFKLKNWLKLSYLLNFNKIYKFLISIK